MSEPAAIGRKYLEQPERMDDSPSFSVTHRDLSHALEANFGADTIQSWGAGTGAFREALNTAKAFPGLSGAGSSFGTDLSSTLEKFFPDKIDAIQVATTSMFPYHSVCQLRLFFPEGVYIGTGWLAAPDTVITVGHNLFGWNENDPASKATWAENVMVAPGRYDSAFFGFGPYESARPLQTTEAWEKAATRKARDRTLDLGMIKLPAPVNPALTPLSFEVLDDQSLRGQPLTVCGYPNDPDTPGQNGQRQWSCTGEITSAESDYLLYRLDTWGGHSGSPLWALVDGTPKVVGIHMGGQEGESNWAVRITHDVADLINSWIHS